MSVDELGPEEFRVAFTQEEHAMFDERAPEREVMLPLSRMTPMEVFAAYRPAGGGRCRRDPFVGECWSGSAADDGGVAGDAGMA